MGNVGDKLPELFYDLIGIFLPGFFLYFCISLMYDNATISSIVKVSFVNEIVIIMMLTYLCGHIIYSLSNYFIAKIFSFFFGVQQNILLGKKQTKTQRFFNGVFVISKIEENNDYFRKNIERKIGEYSGDKNFILDEHNYVIAYEFCRNFIRENTPRTSNIIRKEQAYGEMARGIVFVSIICAFWLLILNYFTTVDYYTYKMLFFVSSFICFSYRYIQARYVPPLFIYSIFCSFSFINKTNENNQYENKD